MIDYQLFKSCKLSLDKIKLRKELSKKYNINLTNTNDVKIGGEIFAKLLSKKKKISIWELKQMRTYRSSINLGNIIFPYIEFQCVIDRRYTTCIITSLKPIVKGRSNGVESIAKYCGKWRDPDKLPGIHRLESLACRPG